MDSSKDLEDFLEDLLICLIKERNLLSITILIRVTLLSGSINLLCVSLGRYDVSLIDTLHVFSIFMASFEKRQDPER